MTVPAAAIYKGHVVHVRKRPRRHRLDYRVFTLLLDLDRMAEAEQTTRLFRRNAFSLIGFRDRDHGLGDGDLRGWVDGLLSAAGFQRPAQVSLLCYPRLLGYVFNPLSVYFCRDSGGELIATVYEVHNTFGERHAYVLPANRGDDPSLVRQQIDKSFLVSPFLGAEGTYRFSIRPPGDGVAVVIRHSDGHGPILDAAFHGRLCPFSGVNLIRMVLQHPLMTHKIIAGIHWEALKLWLKGVPFLGRRGRGQAQERAQQG